MTAYIRFLTLEARQEVVCRTRHRAPPRVAGWLAHVFDLAERDEVHLTQNVIADFFGLQRTTVNAVSKTLKVTGAIKHRRDKISLADPVRLRRLACDCRTSITEDRAHLGLPLLRLNGVRTRPAVEGVLDTNARDNEAFAERLSQSLMA